MAEGHANLASAYKDRLVYMPSNISHFLSLPCCMTLHAMAYFDAFILWWSCILIWHSQINLCFCSGHVEAAIKSYKQALVLRPDFPEATCNLLHTLQVIMLLTIHWLLCFMENIRYTLVVLLYFPNERLNVLFLHMAPIRTYIEQYVLFERLNLVKSPLSLSSIQLCIWDNDELHILLMMRFMNDGIWEIWLLLIFFQISGHFFYLLFSFWQNSNDEEYVY